MAGFREFSGNADAHDLQIAIVAARFNEVIVDKLLAGATETLVRMGSESANIRVIRVPGAWELPLAAQAAASTGRIDAIIALGAVIRGDTAHFDYICAECAAGLSRVALEYKLPVSFGVLTCDTAAQAEARCGNDSENKGAEAAIAAVEMAQALRRLDL
ncbi:MAG: 6,7-dimethyl-8-ribityllumazine synthase [Gammaproteobacteria bacterium]|nr:6,7-dimethyl-8-ribityllumazine synthase [Gammaproteobacteria bacterium]NNF59962.1 6,7-dimethyl-8-ribityllumazine synthase [Gammaproteobacteria bacterium]NNM19674.1 6,7-dimethyl-8-ribityllumazine synthase [Gammaproteobacteria bacterium]